MLAQANRILRMRLPRGGFATAFLAMVSDGRLRYCNAGHPPPSCCGPTAAPSRCGVAGCRWAIEEDGRHEEREVEIGARRRALRGD